MHQDFFKRALAACSPAPKSANCDSSISQNRGTMDPASALGVAAASVQLSGVAAIAVLRGIGILKTFKETPANLAELLIDVERSILSTLNLRNQLMNPASNLRQRLPSGQHQALHDALDETYEATLGLQEIIEPLLADSSVAASRGKRVWKTMVSIKKKRKSRKGWKGCSG